MKRSWLLYLFIALSFGMLTVGMAGAAAMVPITVCTDCHGTNPQTNVSPIEGTERNNPARSIIGSHSYHVNTQGLTCAQCHVVPAALDHRDGKINMAATMAGGVTYSAAVGGIVTQDNQLNTTGLGTCTGTSCHSTGSPTWGTISTCQTCHGYPPVTIVDPINNKHVAGATPVNHIGVGATVNTAATFVSAHGGCQICHGTQSTTDGTGTIHDPHANYTVSSQHGTGNINMNGPTAAPSATSTQYDDVTRGCNAACHANDATHRMGDSAKTITFGEYGGGGDCLSCHAIAQNSPIAQALDASVTQRLAIVPDFSLASKHIRSRTASPAVTTNDCGVCHMEGDAATGLTTAFHKNGRIELRDPDLGTTIKGVTHSGTTSAPGAYTSTATDATPVRFSRNLNSATIEADTAAIMVNQCLKCHDATGAASTTARVPSGTATNPFNATVGSMPAGGVLNVAAQFASTNRSFHPVLVRQNNGYTNTGGTRMVAPWNGVAKSATTTVYGPLITCWDCHAPNNTGAVTITTSGIHGGAVNGTDAVPLRGNVYVNGTTAQTNLCIRCHVVSGGTTNHGTGSAITSSTNGGMTYFQNRCYFCHGTNATKPARPIPSGDAHGFNARGNSWTAPTAFPAANNGYAFLRNEGWYANSYTQSIRSIGATTYTPTCGGMGTGGGCSRTSMGGYTPGGVY